METNQSPQVYQIKITLARIQPAIWRRVLVADQTTLLELHDVIQAVFGWYDSHLHEFIVKNRRYRIEFDDEFIDGFEEWAVRDEASTKLSMLGLQEGSRFTYEYDFGDCWLHTLLVEKVYPIEAGMKLPVCIKGKRARPPEDIGGVWGYRYFLDAIHDPKYEEHEQFQEWVGEQFDSEAFDLEVANEKLQQRTKQRRSDILRPWSNENQIQFTVGDSERRNSYLNKDGGETAADLPLRRDVVSLLTYIKDNKVIGTQATGNFPRKTVAELAARFVHPPHLETKIGESVYRFQSEDDVWPVHFTHVLAEGAKLLSGGPSRRWRLIQAGDAFLDLSPIDQIGMLWDTWWHRTDWLIAYSSSIFEDELPEHFYSIVLLALRQLPVNQPIPFETFAGMVVEAVGWEWEKREPDYTRSFLYAGVERMVIDRMEDFGVLTTMRVEYEQLPGIEKLASFTISRFGQALLE